LAHESFSRDEGIEGSSNRAFGLVFAAVFLIVALLPLLSGEAVRWWSAAVATVFGALAVLAPPVLGPLNKLWTRLGLLLHRIVNPVVLGVMFFIVVTPTGLLMRIAGKDPLRLKRDDAVSTYWIERDPPGPSPDSFRDQF
jgi:hypothetical protein